MPAPRKPSYELKNLEREASTSKTMLESLLARYKQTSGTQDFQLPDAHIVEKADIPLYPASPKRKQLVIIATIAGLILGVGIAILLELMAPGVSRPEDVSRALQVEHLSSLPALYPEVGEQVPAAKAVRLIVAEPNGIYADAIRGARRELDARRRVPGPRIILVTSSMPNEGADTVASNLAHHFALTGARVLLADADMRRQPLTRQLAPTRLVGLAKSLSMRRPVETAILRDSVTGLHFLPAAGPSPLTGSIPELLGSAFAAESIGNLRTRFDVIVVSGPPVMPVIDSRILADFADQILFVMTWQKTPKALAKKALKLFSANFCQGGRRRLERSRRNGSRLRRGDRRRAPRTAQLGTSVPRRRIEFDAERPTICCSLQDKFRQFRLDH